MKESANKTPPNKPPETIKEHFNFSFLGDIPHQQACVGQITNNGFYFFIFNLKAVDKYSSSFLYICLQYIL